MFLNVFWTVNIFELTSCGYLGFLDAPGDERDLHAPMEAAEWGNDLKTDGKGVQGEGCSWGSLRIPFGKIGEP